MKEHFRFGVKLYPKNRISNILNFLWIQITCKLIYADKDGPSEFCKMTCKTELSLLMLSDKVQVTATTHFLWVTGSSWQPRDLTRFISVTSEGDSVNISDLDLIYIFIFVLVALPFVVKINNSVIMHRYCVTKCFVSILTDVKPVNGASWASGDVTILLHYAILVQNVIIAFLKMWLLIYMKCHIFFKLFSCIHVPRRWSQNLI